MVRSLGNPAVITPDPHAVGWFDLDSLPIMQNARRARLATAKTGFDMGVPFNELNRVLDLGFKPLPHADTCYLPTTVQSVAQLPPAPPAANSGPKQLDQQSAQDKPDFLQSLQRLHDLLRQKSAM